ncbi:MAG TPA: ABC transporter permease [Gemmatimonadaceae bacterium]|nr:ABC transporter permease [Gemmatimonadaceae bacterium]
MSPAGRFRRLFRLPWRSARRIREDVDEELGFHLDMRVEELVAGGLTREAARGAARRQFGDLEYTRAYCRDQDARGESARRRLETLDELWFDLRYAARVLRRSPGFAAVAVLTLALGVGATTAIFSAVHAVLLRPLPYPDAGRVVMLWARNARTGDRDEAAPADYLDWRAAGGRAFAGVAALQPYGHDYTPAGGEPETLRSSLVGEDFFRVMGVGALVGRALLPEDFAGPAGARVVVISHQLWRSRFGADPAVVGRTVTLDRRPYTVVGVMPPEFPFPADRQLWAPMVLDEREARVRGGGYIPVVARLRPGVALAQAQREADEIAARLARDYPRTNAQRAIELQPLPDYLTGQVRPALLVLLGAVGMVLLIACANVANLLLARGSQRRHELAVRGALGASRGRLVRQLAAESALLAALGGAAGTLVAVWGARAITALAPADVPRIETVTVDASVLAFAAAVTLLTALLFGLAPAVQAAGVALSGSLAAGSRAVHGGAPRRGGLRGALIAAEVALAMVLGVGAGLLLRSFWSLLRVDPGFVAENRLTVQLFVWDGRSKPEERVAFIADVLGRVAALPGVRSAGAVSALPFGESRIGITTGFTIPGRPVPPPEEVPRADYSVATPGYFDAMGIPLRRGRLFAPADGPRAPSVVLVNETFARRHFPNDDPVGQRVTLRYAGNTASSEIVGVVGDVRQVGLDQAQRPEVYVAHAQSGFGSMTLVVRTSADPAALLGAVKAQVYAADPQQPIWTSATLDQLVDRSLAGRRFSVVLIGAFSALALLLAAVGIYGLVSFTTAQRTRELGLRMALGARASDILAATMKDALALTGIGVAAGLAGAWSLTRVLGGMLYGIAPTDPATFVALAALVACIAALASYLPARRATRLDPVAALRND